MYSKKFNFLPYHSKLEKHQGNSELENICLLLV